MEVVEHGDTTFAARSAPSARVSRDRRAARDPGPADVIAGALTDWRPTLGELVWWTPADEDAIRAAAVLSDVGPSFLQRDHLLAAHARRASGGPHRAVVTVTTEVDEPLDTDAMARALTDFARTHDELRSRFVVGDDGSLTRWVTPGEAVVLSTRREAAPPDHAALVDVLHRRIDRDATYDRIPGWSVGAIDAGSSFALHVTFDHSHTDGSAAIEALQEIVVRFRSHVADTEPALRPAGSHLAHVSDELRRAAAVTADDPLVERWRAVLVANGRPSRAPHSTSASTDPNRPPPSRSTSPSSTRRRPRPASVGPAMPAARSARRSSPPSPGPSGT